MGAMSAIGTAAGPSLGGLVLAHLGWTAVFLLNVPIGLLALVLVGVAMDADRENPREKKMTSHGAFSMARDPRFRAALATNALVSAVVMATLVVGPFYLSRAMGLDAAAMGLALSLGPIVVALANIPAGRIADSYGTDAITLAGLAGMALGCSLLFVLPTALGVGAYVGPVAVLTLGYSLFQTANNTAVMKDMPANRRGAAAGMLSLSRNVGLIGGASVMGWVFALAVGGSDAASAASHDVARGMRVTFALAALSIAVAMALAARSRRSQHEAICSSRV
jgi:predicted MFS family arabinose efflux permease